MTIRSVNTCQLFIALQEILYIFWNKVVLCFISNIKFNPNFNFVGSFIHMVLGYLNYWTCVLLPYAISWRYLGDSHVNDKLRIHCICSMFTRSCIFIVFNHRPNLLYLLMHSASNPANLFRIKRHECIWKKYKSIRNNTIQINNILQILKLKQKQYKLTNMIKL